MRDAKNEGLNNGRKCLGDNPGSLDISLPKEIHFPGLHAVAEPTSVLALVHTSGKVSKRCRRKRFSKESSRLPPVFPRITISCSFRGNPSGKSFPKVVTQEAADTDLLQGL